MKKFIRGLYGRTLGAILIVLMMAPSANLFGLPSAQASGGRQNIIFLPLATTDDDAPYDLAGRISRELQVCLTGGQVGVEVTELTRTSPLLTRAKLTLGDEKFATLLESYNTAINPSAKSSERVKAAGDLVSGLGVDAVIYGAIDQYEFTTRPDPQRSYVHLSATKVTVEDGQAMAYPFVVIGKSRVLPDKGGSQATHDTEAIGNISRNLALQLTGGKPISDNTAQTPVATPYTPSRPAPSDNNEDVEAPKPHTAGWILPAAVGVVVALIFGGKGSGKSVTPPPIIPGMAFATPSSSGVDFQLVKPDKFDQLVSFRIKRVDRGLAGSRALASRQATDVVATIGVQDLVLQNNFVYLSDGPRSTKPPVAGHIYEYSLEAVYSDGTTTPFDVVNLSNRTTSDVGPNVPPPVQNVTVTPVAGSIVNITWDVGATLPSFVTGFIIERKLAGDPISAWAQDGGVVPADARSAQRSVPATGQYQYRVFAVTATNVVNPTQVSGALTVVAGKPQGPAGVDVTALPRAGVPGAVSLQAQWPLPIDNFVTGYKVYRSKQQRSSTFDSITSPGSKLPPAVVRSRSRNNARGSVRRGPSVGRDVLTWDLVKTIATRGETSYLDDDITNSFEYTYRVVAVAGAFEADPVDSRPFRVNLDPGNVTGLLVTNSRGAVTLTWQAPAKNADGLSDMTDGASFEIWRSNTLAAGTNTVTRAVLLQKFAKLTTVGWAVGTYNDATAPLRQAVSYVVIPIDTSGQFAPGDYPVVGLTPMPDVSSLTMAPTDLNVTLGGPAERLTVTAVGTDNQPVPNINLVADCRNGLLAKTADGAGAAASQQLITGNDGKAIVYWKSVAAGEDFVTVNVMAAGKQVGISNQTHIVIKPPVAESLTLTVADTSVVAVKSTDTNTSLDPSKVSITTATAKLTDSKGVPVPGKRVTFACSDLNIGFPGPDGISGNADDTNSAVTDQNGVATVKVRGGFKVGTVTLVAFVGALTQSTPLTVTQGLPAAINMTLQTDRLPARDTSSTTGTVEVKDANGNVVPNTVVLLTATMGSVDPVVATTGDDGKATFTLKATSLADGQVQADVTVTAGVLSVDPPISVALPVTYVGLFTNRIDLTSNVPNIVADNSSQAVITAKVYDVFGQPVPDNTEVVFNVSGGGGVFQGSSTSDIKVRTINGVATVVLQGTPANQALTLTVKATSGPVENTLSILMQPQSDVTKVIVTPTLTTLVVNGVIQTRINIQVTDNAMPVNNTVVTINTTAGVLSQNQATTKADGFVYDNQGVQGILFTGPNKAQIVTITATGKGITGAAQITVRGGLPSLIELSLAGPWALLRTNGRPATGADFQSQMFARITDEYGNPVPDGTQVFFEIVEPGSYQYMQALDYQGNPFPAPGVPQPNTGKPYGTITPAAVTAGGSCTVNILSADRNTPAGGAEIIARVNRPDGRIVFANTFRVAGPAQYQSRVLMVGGPVIGNPLNPNSFITLDAKDKVAAGTPIKVTVTLNDELGQPCAGNTPYTMSFAFTDDQSQALPPIVGKTTEVGTVEQTILVTDLKNLSSRPFAVKFDVGQQLMEQPVTIFSDQVTITAGAPTAMTLTLVPVVNNTSNTQIYAFPEPVLGFLGPDQIKVVADNIKDKYGNPALTTVQDPTSTVTFTAFQGRFVPTLASGLGAEQAVMTADVTTSVVNGQNDSSATVYYRCRSNSAENIFATLGGAAGQLPIKVIGGAKTLKFDAEKPAIQMGADQAGFDSTNLTITALDAAGKPIAAADAVGVWLNSAQGQLQNLPAFIPLDNNSQIKGVFKAFANVAPGPGYLQYNWASGIFSNAAENVFGLTIVGQPTDIQFLNPPTFINSTDTATLTVQVKDVNGTNILKGSTTVQFSVDNPGLVLVPANGAVLVGDNGLASVQVKAADPTKVTVYNFIVTAKCGKASASTNQIAFKKPAKTVTVSYVGGALLPTDADVHKWIDGKTEETTIVVTALDDAGLPVPDGTPLTTLTIAGVNATFVDPTTGNELGNAPGNLTFTNGRVTLKIHGKGGPGGNATVTAASGAAQVIDKTLNFVGPPSKLTLTVAPASPGVVNSPVACNVTVQDANNNPVFTGYQLTTSTNGTASTLINGLASPQNVTETNGSANFVVRGTTAGNTTITVNYGAALTNTAYVFQGTGNMVFSYVPANARILSDGTQFVTITVNGFLPATNNPVPDGTDITLTTDKGFFKVGANQVNTITGKFVGGVYAARLYGKQNPGIADLGAVTIEADSSGNQAFGGATFYGPVNAITFDDPGSLNVVVNRAINLTARVVDVAGNPADAAITVKTTDSKNAVVTVNVNAAFGSANFNVTPTVVGNYTVDATTNGKKATLVFSVNASIPQTITVAPVGVQAALARVTADGTGAPLQYRITAIDAFGQPAGNFNATVAIDPAGVISLDQFDFSNAKQQVDVPIDATGTGTFWVNGAAGAQVGPATITVTTGALSTNTTVRLIGLATTLVFTPLTGSRLLANDNDRLSFRVDARDAKNQTVMDGTRIAMTVAPVNGGDPPLAGNEYRFVPALPTTTNGTVTVDFYTKRIAIVKNGVPSGLDIVATVNGQGGPVAKDSVVSAEGAQTLNLALVANQPARISADGISGPNGTNQTQVRITGTAVDSGGNLLQGAQLSGLPVTVTTQKGVLNNQTATVTTAFDNTGVATLTLSGTITTTPGSSNVTATSGDATSPALAVAFVGPADAVNGFTYVSNPVAVNNKLTVYQNVQFTLQATAKDAAGQAVLKGSTMSILPNGLAVAGNTDIVTTDDTGRVSWTITASQAGTRDVFVKADNVTANTPFTVTVVPVAADFAMAVQEEKKIFFDPTTTATLPKSTSFILTGYQSVNGPVQPYAEITLTTDMGTFVTSDGVTPQANGKIAKVVLNQAGTQLVRFTGDSANIGTPNIIATSGTVNAVTKALNTAAQPIQLIGPPFRIICQASSKYQVALSDNLKVMEDDPVTITASVQDKAGNNVLDGFMVDFRLPAGSPGILRARNTLIAGGTVKADLSSNTSGVFVVTAQAQDTTGADIPGVNDPTTVTIRTYARTITLDSVGPTRISQDGAETAKITVLGVDANGTSVLAGTPAQFTILQNDPLLAVLVDPLNAGNFGAMQNVVFDSNGKAEIFVRGQGVVGKIGSIGVQVASYNTDQVPGPNGQPIFLASMANQVSLYGPGHLAVDNPDLTAVMAPVKVVPGSAGVLTVALMKNNIAYNPSWYSVAVTSDVGTITGVQTLQTAGVNAGQCALNYTITAADATAKLASINPQIKVTVTVTGNEQAGTGTLTRDFFFTIADKPWPGITDPATKYTVTAKTPATLLDAAPNGGLNLNTKGTVTIQLQNAAGQTLGQGRDITILSSDGFVGDDALGDPTQGTATVQTGADGKITLRIIAPNQKPATGQLTLTIKDGASTLTQVDGTGNPMGSNLITINVKDAKLVATFDPITIGATKRIYYSTLPQDTIYTKNAAGNYVVLPLPTTTTVTFRGKTNDAVPVGAAGATVTVTTDRGVIRKNGTADAFAATKTYTLDALGFLTLDIQGNALDADLGTPRFTVTAVDSNVTQTFDSNPLQIVGKANTVVVTPSAATFFQNAETDVTITVTDKAGQAVLDGWPVEFIQSSTQWADPTVAEWWETGGDGIFRLPVVPATTNGVCTSQFASNHSGRYTIGANVPRDFTPGAPPVPNFITSTQDVTVKTFARNYVVKQDAIYPSRILADGTEVTHLYVICSDNDNKKLLEGVKVAIRPNVGRLLQEDSPNLFVNGPAAATAFAGSFMEMAVNQDAEIRLLVRGNNRIGHVGLQMNNDIAQSVFVPNPPLPVPVYSWDTVAAAVPGAPDVVLYGPDLTTATIGVDLGVQTIAGSNTGNTIPANMLATYALTIKDKFGNPFPAGFRATVVVNGTRIVDPPTQETDENGQITLNYSEDLIGAIAKRQITIYVEGDGAVGAINKTFSPQPPLPAVNLIVTKPISATMPASMVVGLNTATPFVTPVLDNDGNSALDGFPVALTPVIVAGAPNIAQPGANTVNGSVSGTINSGGATGSFTIRAMYLGITNLGTSGVIYIGAPANNVVNLPANAQVGTGSATAITATLSTAGQNIAAGYPVALALEAGNGGAVAGGNTNVGANGQVSFTYTAPAVAAGQSQAIKIDVSDRAPLASAGTLRTVITLTAVGVPAQPAAPSCTAGSKTVTISWVAPLSQAPIDTYQVVYRVNGGAAQTVNTAALALPALTLNAGDVVTATVSAHNVAGWGAASPQGTGIAAP